MEYEPKIIHLPGTTLTPEVVLHRTLAKLDHIASVAIVIEWKKDQTYDVDWSQQQVSGLCMASMVLQNTVMRVATGEDSESVRAPAPESA